jgi:uncharacterized membrane protein
MAGIGFKLEKILSKNSYLSLFEGYVFSSIVSAGPLLMTIASIGLLSLISLGSIDPADVMVFRMIVVYIYGASLISSSCAQMIITRYMADRIFLKDFRSLAPAFVGVMLLSIVLHAVIGCIAAPYLELNFATSATAVVLFICIGIIWIAMIALSAAKEFVRIAKSFFFGMALSVAAGYFLGKHYGVLGLTAGFTVGQVLLVILLVLQIFSEFDYRNRVEFYFLSYFKKFTSLAFIATLYNIAVWADKFIFWFSPETGQTISGFLHASYIYDAPVFLAYLFIVPSLAMFTIRIETSFYVAYKKYFLSILENHPRASVDERRENILDVLKLSLGRMIVFQGTITVVGLVASASIYDYLGLSAINLGIFQITILSTFILALLQSLLILMLYFDYRMDALVMSSLFAATNIVFTLISIRLGFSYYGFGFFASCFVSLIAGFILFNYRLRKLLFHTFVSQKIVVREGAI